MKRSEAIEILGDIIALLVLDDDFYKQGKDYCAEIILDKIEDVGMLPPPEYINTLNIDNEKGILIEVSYPYPVDKNGQFPLWEPEDET